MSNVTMKIRMDIYTSFAYSYPSIHLEKFDNLPPEIINNPVAIHHLNTNYKNTKNTLNGLTVMNILGYIPIVGLIIGIARIILCQISLFFKETLKLTGVTDEGLSIIKESMIVKGILECCSIFGIFNCIFDIVGTLHQKKLLND